MNSTTLIQANLNKSSKNNGLMRRFAFALLFVITFCFVSMLTAKPVAAVVGGQQANIEPWMVGIAFADEHDGYFAQFCGGTLIDAEWVLTAAHCTVDSIGREMSAADIDVIINRQRLSSNDGERIAVIEIVRHENFSLATYDADVALLKLASPSTNRPIRIASGGSAAMSTVFGWGMTENGYATDVLKRVDVPLVDDAACSSAYERFGRTVNGNMLCAGYTEGGADACTGDSGGPLVRFDEATGELVQMGIVSWGEGCGNAQAYGVYTNLNVFANWIVEQIG